MPITPPPTDQSWFIKSILWPPHHPHPSPVSIILQNSNGPCSLLAISNILLLSRKISLPAPPNRSSISFPLLSSTLADYLLSLNSFIPFDPSLLHNALSVLPLTRTGLDLNPSFDSIRGFHPDPDGRFILFSTLGIDLVHGWLPDPQDTLTYSILIDKFKNYDHALESLVLADHSLHSNLSSSPSSQDLLSLHDANIVKNFFDSTPTQLSYAGLFQLASDLVPGSLAALLRNSHLSVLYRRPSCSLPVSTPTDPNRSLPSHDNSSDSAHSHSPLPKLFTLVTDLSFLNDPSIVWESLEDVEGGLSEFYDSKLEKSPLRSNLSQPRPVQDQSRVDFELAHQLQQQEYRSAQAPSPAPPILQPSQVLPPPVMNPPQPTPPPVLNPSSAQALAPSVSSTPASTSTQVQPPHQPNHNHSTPTSPLNKFFKRQKKKDCAVM